MPGSVLLVHDDISAIAAARRVLVAEGLEVSLATSCADAFTSYQQRPYQLVVLAPAIESGRGASVYDEIRSLPSGARVRFILLGSEVADAKGVLIVDLPIDAEAFRAAVREVMRSKPDTQSAPRRVPTASEPEATTVEAPPWGGVPAPARLDEQLFGSAPTPSPPGEEPRPPSAALVMPAVSIGEPSMPAPEPYAAPQSDGPTIDAPLRWDDLNVPSEEPPPDVGRTPLTVTDARPATVETPPISAARERRVLAEISAAAEIADRARAVTAPSRPVDKVRTAAEVEAELEARHRSQVAEIEAKHEAELAAALARLQDERTARAAVEAELTTLEAEQAAGKKEREREDEKRAASEQEAQSESQQRLHEALHALASLEERMEGERAARGRAEAALAEKAREAERGAEAEVRAHAAAQHVSELEQRAARTQAELEARQAEETRARAEAERRASEAEESRAQVQKRADEVASQLAASRKSEAELEQKLAEALRRAQERAERERAAEQAADAEQQRLSDTERAYRDVEAQLTEEAGARSSAEQRAHDLAAQRIELEQALEDAERRSRAELEKIAALEDANEESAAALAALGQRRAEAEQSLAEAAGRQTELERAAAEVHERADAEKAAMVSLQSRRAALESAAEEQGAARRAVEEETKALAEQLAEIQHAAQAAHDLADAERVQVSRLEAARVEAQRRLEAEQRARAEVEKHAQALHLQRQKTQKEGAAASSRAQAAAAARAEAEKACHDLEVSLAKGAQEQQAEEARIAELGKRAQLEEERRSGLERAKQEAVARLKALTQERTQAERGVQQTSAERDTLARQAHEASARVQAELKQLEQLQHALGEATRRRDLARRSTEAGERKQAELTEQAVALRKQAETTEQEAQAQIERATELEQARQTAEAQIGEERTRHQVAAEQLEVASAEVAKLEAVTTEAERKLEVVRAERREAEAHAAEIVERRATFAATLARIEGELGGAPAASTRPVTEPNLAAIALEAPPERAVEPESRAAGPEPIDDESTRRPTVPNRRALRPLAGGRWQRAEVGPSVRLPPEVEAARPALISEGPVEARAPRFPTAGRLSDLGAATFFAESWRDRVTGRFDFDCRDGARALFFEEGRLVAAVSNAASERLESLAHRDGLITRAHVRALRPEAERLSARQLAVYLVELKLIKGAELYSLVRRQMEEVAYSLFADDSVEYLYGSDLAPSDLRVALPMTALAFMVEGVRRKGDFDRLNPALGGPTARVKLVREGAPDLAELGLSARERRLVALIDGLRTTEELIFASGLDPHAAVKLLYALRAAGFVETLAVEPQPALDEGRDELRIDLTRVGEKYDQVQNGDYFEILGVTPDATTYEVRQAFERVIREFHPGRFTAVADASLSSRLSEIGRMVAEAADVLSDDVTRREYARNLTGA